MLVDFLAIPQRNDKKPHIFSSTFTSISVIVLFVAAFCHRAMLRRAERDIATASCPSVRPSVCLSVCNVEVSWSGLLRK